METAGATPMPRAELLNVADTVAREKGIEREEVLEAMEQAFKRRVARNTVKKMTFVRRLIEKVVK